MVFSFFSSCLFFLGWFFHFFSSCLFFQGGFFIVFSIFFQVVYFLSSCLFFSRWFFIVFSIFSKKKKFEYLFKDCFLSIDNNLPINLILFVFLDFILKLNSFKVFLNFSKNKFFSKKINFIKYLLQNNNCFNFRKFMGFFLYVPIFLLNL